MLDRWVDAVIPEGVMAGEAQDVNETVHCLVCDEEKPVASFYLSMIKRGQRRCRQCCAEKSRAWREANRGKAREYSRSWYARNKEKAAESSRSWERRNRAKRTERLRDLRATGWKLDYDLWTRYGITVEDYQRMLEDQDHVCGCCGAEAVDGGPRLYVDHDHETGEVRGLLCNKCNSGIGLLGDTHEGVFRAACYLRSEGTAGLGEGLLY